MTTQLLTALARLPAGHSTLTIEQTAWLRSKLAACGLSAHSSTPAGDTWSLDLEGALDERASALITLPPRGCGSVLMTRGWRHVDASESQLTEQAAPAPTKTTTNGGRAAAQALLARLANKKAA